MAEFDSRPRMGRNSCAEEKLKSFGACLPVTPEPVRDREHEKVIEEFADNPPGVRLMSLANREAQEVTIVTAG